MSGLVGSLVLVQVKNNIFICVVRLDVPLSRKVCCQLLVGMAERSYN